MLKDRDLVIDGTNGGLVIGPSHRQGGILFLVRQPWGYSIEGELEGLEYICNKDCTENYNYKLESINETQKSIEYRFKKYSTPKSQPTIKTKTPWYSIYGAKFLLMDDFGFTIINKKSTKEYLKELNILNSYY